MARIMIVLLCLIPPLTGLGLNAFLMAALRPLFQL